MNDEQAAAAKEALLKIKIETSRKKWALVLHQDRQQATLDTGIPFKIISEFEKTHPGRTPPNAYYPSCRAEQPSFWQWMKRVHPEQIPDNVIDALLPDLNLKPQYAYLQSEYESDIRTPPEQLTYYMAHFLKGYDLQEFSSFDFWGDTTRSEAETMAFYNQCMALQQAFEERPQDFYNPDSDNEESEVKKYEL